MSDETIVLLIALAIAVSIALTAIPANAAPRCVWLGQSYVCAADAARYATGQCIQIGTKLRCF